MIEIKKYKFSDLYSMSSGISSKPEQAGHGAPFASFSTIFNNYFLPGELPNLMDTSLKEQETYSIKKGDIFLTRTSETIDELGLSSVALKDYPKATYSGFVKRLRPLQSDITYAKYMGFYLRSKFFRKTMTNNAVLTLRASLNEEIFSYLNLLLPDYNTQKSAGDFLHLLNTKIEVNNRINAELEAMAKTLYDYWFVQFDFPDAEGKPYKTNGGKMVWSDELKREIPEGWEAGSILKVADLLGGGTPNTKDPSYWDGEIPFFTPKDTEDSFFVVSTQQSITEKGLKNCSTRLFSKGTIFVTARGTVGNINIASQNMAMNQSCYALQPKGNINYYFLHLCVSDVVNQLKAKSNGSIFDAIVSNDFKFTSISIPPSGVIAKFDTITESFYEKILSNQLENQRLASLRDWLLPMLMNGQLRVGGETGEQAQVVEQDKTLFIADSKKPFAKQVLGGKIVSLFQNDPHFNNIKFQKLQYLAEHLAEVDLGWNYYYQAAGPYDNVYMHSIADRFAKSQWFARQDNRYVPLDKQPQIDEYYQAFFKPVQPRLDQLFALLANATDIEAEIIATLYAVWNNRIILNQPISDAALIDDFYNWSDRKLLYTHEQLTESLAWMRTHQLIPVGFGKEIKRAKGKK